MPFAPVVWSTPDLRHRAELVTSFARASAAVAISFGAYYTFGLHYLPAGLVMAFGSAAFLGCVRVLHASLSPARAANYAAVITLGMLSFVAGLRDDLPIPTLMLFVILLLVLAYVAGRRSTLAWTVVASLFSVAFAVRLVVGIGDRLINTSPQQVVIADVGAFIGLLVIVSLLAQSIGARRVQAEREQTGVQNELRQAQRFESIGRLAGGVADELSNPLACIYSNLENALALCDVSGRTAQMRPCLADALSSAEQMRHMLYDLRRYGDKEDSPPTPLQLQEIIESALRLMVVEIRDRANVVTDLQNTEPVLGSRSRLARAFMNLVLCIADGLPHQGPQQSSIFVTTRMQGPTVVVELGSVTADASHGQNSLDIPPPSDGIESAGTPAGAGLDATASILSHMGGTLSVESSMDTVRRFVIRLPAAR